MKIFAAGLILGLVVGIGLGGVGSVRWARAKARRPERSSAVAVILPAKPIENAQALAKCLDALPYEVGFFAKDLETGRITERFGDRAVCLASMVKVFCLTELYRQKHEEALAVSTKIRVPDHGDLSLTAAADLMIGQSDNAATHALAEFLGRVNVNRIPSLLGLDSLSGNILPSEAVLRQTLDKRIFGGRHAAAGLPQHGTARDMAGFFERLLDKRVISEAVSEDLVEFFSGHPMPYSNRYAGTYNFAGKGGNILWTRPPKHYAMMGWNLFVTKPSGGRLVLCVWGEWFPQNLDPEKQTEFLKFVTDSVIGILEGQAAAVFSGGGTAERRHAGLHHLHAPFR